jgi:UDP-glucuronate decarboxylase
MIRWIDDTLGTAAFDDPDTHGYHVFDVRSLVDGPANGCAALREIIDAGVDALQKHNKLVVCCDYGISRSNTIAASILSRRNGVDFDSALAIVQKQTAEVRMEYGLVQTVRSLFHTVPPLPAVRGRVLITGGTGFLGQWVKKTASNRLDIVIVGSQEINLLSDPYSLDRAIREHRPDTIIHLANPRIYQTPEVIAHSLAMLRNVADVCHGHGIFLVYASSWVVLNGLKSSEEIMALDDYPSTPYGNYAISKGLCEQYVDYLTKAGKIQACILRMTPIYGRGSPQPRFLFRTAEACLEGRVVRTHLYRNARPRLQLLHASDAANALILAVEKRIPGRFNIGSDNPLTTHEIAATVARVLGTQYNHEEISLEAEVANISLDSQKAKALLGWQQKTTLDNGIHDLFKVERV